MYLEPRMGSFILDGTTRMGIGGTPDAAWKRSPLSDGPSARDGCLVQ
jgi:hypothetical protein